MSVDQDNQQCPPRRLTIALLKQNKELREQLDEERRNNQKLVQNQVTKTQPLTPRWNDQIEDNDEHIQGPYSDCLEQDQVQSLLDDLNQSIVKSNSLRELLQEEQEKNQALKDQMKEEIKAKAAALRDMQELQRQRDKLQIKMETLTSVLEQKRRADEEMQEKYEAIRNQMKEEMKGKVAAEGDVMKLQREKEKLETEVLSLRNALEQESHAKDNLKSEVSSLRSSLEEGKPVISAPTQEKIDILQKRVLKTRQKMEGLKETHAKQLWTEKLNVQEVSEALTTAENNNSALRQEYKELQEATVVKQEKLEREKEELQTQVLSLRNSLEQESCANERRQDKMQEEERRIDDLKGDLSSQPSQKQIDILQKRMLKTKKKMQCLRESHAQQLGAEKLKVQELSEALTHAENNNAALRKEFKELQDATEVKQERSLWPWRKRLFRRGVKVHPMNVPSA